MNRAQLDHLDKPDLLDLEVNLVLLEVQDREESLDREVNLELLVHRDPLDLKDLLDHVANLARLENLV